jgi:hypothetical protein
MNFFIFAIFCSIAALAFAQDVLLSTEQIHSKNDRKLVSADGRFRVDMQSDGNFVIYNEVGNYVWSTQTSGSGAIAASMEADGQFCLYDMYAENVWSTYTYQAGSFLKMQNDGNLVMYNPQGHPVYSSAFGYAGKKTTI